jgi:hypothetical protein
MPLLPWLLSIAGSVAGRVLLALGMSIVSFAGLSTLVANVNGSIQDNYNSLPATTLQLANIGGLGDFLSIITSAFVTRVSLVALKKFRLK